MKNKHIIATIALLSILGFASAQTVPDTLVQRLGQQYIKNPEPVGLSIGLYIKGKAYYYNFGTTQKGTAIKSAANTIYEIGSITKTFTSTVLAYAIGEGKISLDDDIRKYLKGSYPNLEYHGLPIKIVNLVNLTSGLPNNLPDDPDLFKNAAPDSIPFILLKQHQNYTRERFLADLHTVKLTSAPGDKPKHSNVSAQLLGYILENVYNQNYSRLLRKFITGPLKMQATGFDKTVLNQQLIAKGYNASGMLMPYIMKDAAGAGGMYSSTADMVKYIALQLSSNNPAIKLSHQPTWGTMQDLAIGFNWQMDNKANGQQEIWHTGGTFGFNSFIIIYPEMQTGIVLLSNEYDTSAQARLGKIAGEIYDGLQRK